MRVSELAARIGVSTVMILNSRKKGAPIVPLEMKHGNEPQYDVDGREWCRWYIQTSNPNYPSVKPVVRKILRYLSSLDNKPNEAVPSEDVPTVSGNGTKLESMRNDFDEKVSLIGRVAKDAYNKAYNEGFKAGIGYALHRLKEVEIPE